MKSAQVSSNVIISQNIENCNKIIEKIDLIPVSVADADPVPAAAEHVPTSRAAEMESSLSNNIIPQNTEISNQNLQENFETDDSFLHNEQQRVLYEKMAEMRGEEAIVAKNVMNIFSKRYGTKFRLFYGDGKRRGFYDSRTNTAHININASGPLVDVISHEFFHDFKTADPEGFELISRYVESDLDINKFTKYKAELLAGYDELGIDYSNLTDEEIYDLVREEAICDLMSEVMRDPTTIERIAKENRTLAQKIIDFLAQIIEDVKRAIAELGTVSDPEVQGLVKNFDEIKALYQEVLVQSDAGPGRRMQNQDGQINNSIEWTKDGKMYVQAESVGKNGEINTIYNVGKMKETSLPLSGSKAEHDSAYGGVSNNSISHNDNSVNSSIRSGGGKDASERIKYSYAGRKAASPDIGGLAKAKRMRRSRESKEAIWRETGWFVGLDGKWRFEIDDSEMEFDIEGATEKWLERGLKLHNYQITKEELLEDILDGSAFPGYKLGELIKHPELFRQYPDLADVSVILADYDEAGGTYTPSNDRITIHKDNPNKRGTLIHEIQHAIQEREGFTRGSSPDMWDGTEIEKFDQYWTTAGEVEAREVRARLGMSKEERQKNTPLKNVPGTVYAEDAPRAIGKSTDINVRVGEKNPDAVLNGENNGAIIEENKESNTRLDSSTLNKESGGIDEHKRSPGKNPEALAEHGVRRTNDSIWTQSDGSETVYESVGRDEGTSRDGLESGRGFIDWGRRIQPYNDSTPRAKEQYNGLLREISERRISNVDSEQKPLSEAIKKYFEKTVLKNEKGELISLFHATNNEFNTFEYGDFGFHLGTAEQAINRGGKYIKEVYINITNPLYASKDRGKWPAFVVAEEALTQGIISKNEYKNIERTDGFGSTQYNAPANISLRNLLKAKGYDGIIYNNDHEGEGLSVIAFDSEQIKYTSNQNPTTSKDLRFSVQRKPRVEAARDALAKYRETGDANDLPFESWTKNFLRGAKNRVRYLDAQMQGAEYDLEYNTNTPEEKNRLTEIIKSLRAKQSKALESLGVAEEIRKVSAGY